MNLGFPKTGAYESGFRVYNRVWGLGVGVYGLGFGVRVRVRIQVIQCFGLNVYGLGFNVSGACVGTPPWRKRWICRLGDHERDRLFKLEYSFYYFLGPTQNSFLGDTRG